MAKIIQVEYYNTIIVKSETKNWHIEESRIKGGFNSKAMDYGVRAHITNEDYRSQRRSNSLIYSGIYNDRTGVNNTNQFPIDKPITLSVDIQQGSIQKLFAEDQKLNIFQEEKVRYVPIDKDIIYTAEGVPLSTTSRVFLGDVVSYGTNYGIGKNPESFCHYAGRKYFVDKPKGAVLRLSSDGITEISNYGMRAFFRDNLSGRLGFGQQIHLSWDIYNKDLVLNMLSLSEPGFVSDSDSYTVVFDEYSNGWTSFFSYIPEGFSGSLDGDYYTFKNNNIYKHNSSSSYNSFYGTSYDSRVDFIFNAEPSANKNLVTINYEGSDSWNISNIETDSDQAENILAYDINNQDLIISAFQKTHNKYYSNIMNATSPSENEVVFGADISGVKGFYAKMRIQTSGTTYKELFSVSTNYNINSY
jgi:hypothetical protein